jgi:hypothetical protein
MFAGYAMAAAAVLLAAPIVTYLGGYPVHGVVLTWMTVAAS